MPRVEASCVVISWPGATPKQREQLFDRVRAAEDVSEIGLVGAQVTDVGEWLLLRPLTRSEAQRLQNAILGLAPDASIRFLTEIWNTQP